MWTDVNQGYEISSGRQLYEPALHALPNLTHSRHAGALGGYSVAHIEFD